jgi:hypothetical protein
LWELYIEAHRDSTTEVSTAEFLSWAEQRAAEHEQFKLMWNLVNDRMLGELMEAAIVEDDEDMYVAAWALFNTFFFAMGSSTYARIATHMNEQLHTGTEWQRKFLRTFCIGVEGKTMGLLCEYLNNAIKKHVPRKMKGGRAGVSRSVQNVTAALRSTIQRFVDRAQAVHGASSQSSGSEPYIHAREQIGPGPLMVWRFLHDRSMGTDELLVDQPGKRTKLLTGLDKQAYAIDGKKVSFEYQNRAELGVMKGDRWLRKYQYGDRSDISYKAMHKLNANGAAKIASAMAKLKIKDSEILSNPHSPSTAYSRQEMQVPPPYVASHTHTLTHPHPPTLTHPPTPIPIHPPTPTLTHTHPPIPTHPYPPTHTRSPIHTHLYTLINTHSPIPTHPYPLTHTHSIHPLQQDRFAHYTASGITERYTGRFNHGEMGERK